MSDESCASGVGGGRDWFDRSQSIFLWDVFFCLAVIPGGVVPPLYFSGSGSDALWVLRALLMLY